ncbi:MAG: class I SAM-dependent methyltransferase [Lachnospiraceae bacterium]|nr:class I SAM-dependent methyltransferase [Lachnospiraceae bacterium]
MELSKRLTMIADLVSPCDCMADIGTDHGFIPIKLVKEGRCKHAFAMDVGVGPLERAKEHIKSHGLEERIECRLSDGYEKLEAEEADSTVIAGMGGDLMVRILSAGLKRDVLTKELILSPHSEWHKVREFLRLHGYKTEKEAMVWEDRKYYVAIKAKKAESTDVSDPVEDAFGTYLLEEKNEVLKDYLLFLKNRYEKILANLEKIDSDSAAKSRLENIGQLELVKGALSRYENV